MQLAKTSLGFNKISYSHSSKFFVRMQYSLGALLFESRLLGLKRPRQRLALKCWRYAANKGHWNAMARLGQLLCHCSCNASEKRLGADYLIRAAKAGIPAAQYELGQCYSQGLGVFAKDPMLAEHWLTLAANQGYK